MEANLCKFFLFFFYCLFISILVLEIGDLIIKSEGFISDHATVVSEDIFLYIGQSEIIISHGNHVLVHQNYTRNFFWGPSKPHYCKVWLQEKLEDANWVSNWKVKIEM